MGLKIKIFSPGKIKEAWLERALGEYEKRLTKEISIEWNLQALPDTPPYICLDPHGKQLTSEEFSTFLYQELEKGGSRLTFVIGGPDGLPPSLIEKASHTLSFSKMTFTHQQARLILLEQIYRAVQIRNKTPYHRE